MEKMLLMVNLKNVMVSQLLKEVMENLAGQHEQKNAQTFEQKWNEEDEFCRSIPEVLTGSVLTICICSLI